MFGIDRFKKLILKRQGKIDRQFFKILFYISFVKYRFFKQRQLGWNIPLSLFASHFWSKWMSHESSALTARQRLKFDKQNEKLNLLRVVNVGKLYFELTMIGKISQIGTFTMF